jgi:hypothetical protein
MITISEKQLGKAIDYINELDVKSYSTFMNDFAKKQPNLVSYMVANAESLSNDAARDELVYLLSIIWICYNSLKLPITKILKREIDKSEKTQLDDWQKLSEITDEKKEAAFTRKFIAQPIIWSFMNSIVLPQGKQKSNFKKDEDVALTYALINLVTFLLDEKVKKGVAKN